MSDSRLEKFIYAICSMDVTDLPVPLSRIETLWNCLITGKTPDFEPLSRNEKYLMAMLDRYDISSLPAPMSRGEKLLYKIAVGETDLSDVPGYLSRYEELLKYLIENGGISGGDFEYVLYILNQSLSTLYSTAEKPVKSAILKGQTLVNISKFESNIERTSAGTSQTIQSNDVSTLKTSTTYTFIYWIESTSGTTISNITTLDGSNTQMFDRKVLKSGGNLESNFILKFSQTSRDFTGPYGLKFSSLNGSVKLVKSVILEGDYTNVDIPYFTGMQSVKLPVLTTSNYKNLANNTTVEYGYISGSSISIQKKWLISDFISIEPNKSYTVRSKGVTNDGVFAIAFYDKDKNFINKIVTSISVSPSNAEFARINVRKNNGLDVTEDEKNATILYLEKTTEVLPFEEHKSNILTVNEDVTLRSNGSVYDELDLLTGKLTQRIDEDGSVLTQEVVKTVDLTTVDQDNKPTQLGTFENVTHVSLESAGLIPTLEMEAATRISTELASASPLMDDISTEQQQLETTVDEQSNNVDATMIATTEIYEEIL